MRFLTVLLATMSLIGLSAGAVAYQTPSTDSNVQVQVQQAAEAFIRAFNNLDWDTVRASFSDDATVFFPFPGAPRRANGKEEIETLFKPRFDAVPREAPGPPYLNIDPRDTKIQLLGNGAVVTSHLEERSRRTVVFERRDRRWIIVHLHASSTVPVQ